MSSKKCQFCGKKIVKELDDALSDNVNRSKEEVTQETDAKSKKR